ncbi:MAG: MerR family DNA-binding transcriptional regulator [Eubacteriales bacterium]|nr:MerR family DNA-binding transcriptional regulator [Eubacteriales bacterium]
MHTYTIREISELFSLPASTLRYYESEGLLPLLRLLHVSSQQSLNCPFKII